ncbi:MAG: hypothetical protein HWN67_04405 [Candidatus Helarchaeota archaeon]|nr:hypothetical protein [Candidatus Helarchaeota archaeon]
MSEDEEKNSDKDDDLLSMVDSLLDSTEEETPKPEIKKESQGTPKKTKVVPVIVRPPKKIKPKPIKIQPKDHIEPVIESIKPKQPESINSKLEIPQKEETTPVLSLDELADTVLEELDAELTTPEVKSSYQDKVKIDYKVKTSIPSYEIEEPKKTIPSSYKIKFGTAKKLKSINLDRDIYVTCPKCKHYFESLETLDIICPKCRSEFSI